MRRLFASSHDKQTVYCLKLTPVANKSMCVLCSGARGPQNVNLFTVRLYVMQRTVLQ